MLERDGAGGVRHIRVSLRELGSLEKTTGLQKCGGMNTIGGIGRQWSNVGGKEGEVTVQEDSQLLAVATIVCELI